ncbi:hypothetical protein D3C86_1686540 [compost metagenome]
MPIPMPCVLRRRWRFTYWRKSDEQHRLTYSSSEPTGMGSRAGDVAVRLRPGDFGVSAGELAHTACDRSRADGGAGWTSDFNFRTVRGRHQSVHLFSHSPARPKARFAVPDGFDDCLWHTRRLCPGLLDTDGRSGHFGDRYWWQLVNVDRRHDADCPREFCT